MDDKTILEKISQVQAGCFSLREELIAAHRDKIAAIASQVSKRRLDWRNDDELSIAMLAFNEALDSFQAERGIPFAAYVRIIIRHRLVDHFRKEGRHWSEVGAGEGLADPATASNPETKLAWEKYLETEADKERAQEILEYAAILAEYGLNLKDLGERSPKHRDTRNNLLKAAHALLSDSNLVENFQRKKQLPVSQLEKITGLSRKVLETGRKYIMAIVLILLHQDLVYLRSFARLTVERR